MSAMNPYEPRKLTTVAEDFKKIGMDKYYPLQEDSSESKPLNTDGPPPSANTTATSEGPPAASYEGKGLRSRLKMVRKAGLDQHKNSDHAAEEGAEQPAEEGWRASFKAHRRAGMAQHKASEPSKKGAASPREENVSELDRAANLMQDALGLVKGLRQNDKTEAVKAFAQVAMLSDKLADRFGGLAEINQSQTALARDFVQAQAEYASMAEAAASVAEDLAASLHEGKAPSLPNAQLKTDFGAMMSDLMQGLDLYSDIQENYEVAECEDCDDDDDDGEEEPEKKDDSKGKKVKVWNFQKKKKDGEEGEKGERKGDGVTPVTDPQQNAKYGEQSSHYEGP